MIGQRFANLCVWWLHVRGVCVETQPAHVVPNDNYGRFLDFAAMWLSGYLRSTVSLEPRQPALSAARIKGGSVVGLSR